MNDKCYEMLCALFEPSRIAYYEAGENGKICFGIREAVQTAVDDYDEWVDDREMSIDELKRNYEIVTKWKAQ